jgi:opacity protein-like surface antigen
MLLRSRAAPWAAALLGWVTSLGCLTATATEADTDEEPALPLKYSVMPFGGYRFGGRFAIGDTNSHDTARNHLSYGAAFDVATDEWAQYELFYSRQSTRLSGPSPAPSDTVIEYLHIGGTVGITDWQRVQPYFLATVGATRFSPDSPLGSDRLYFSLSLGGGVRFPFNDHLALRCEARGFATFFNTNTNVFCRSDQAGGVCLLRGSGSTFFQGETLAGLAYTF